MRREEEEKKIEKRWWALEQSSKLLEANLQKINELINQELIGGLSKPSLYHAFYSQMMITNTMKLCTFEQELVHLRSVAYNTINEWKEIEEKKAITSIYWQMFMCQNRYNPQVSIPLDSSPQPMPKKRKHNELKIGFTKHAQENDQQSYLEFMQYAKSDILEVTEQYYWFLWKKGFSVAQILTMTRNKDKTKTALEILQDHWELIGSMLSVEHICTLMADVRPKIAFSLLTAYGKQIKQYNVPLGEVMKCLQNKAAGVDKEFIKKELKSLIHRFKLSAASSVSAAIQQGFITSRPLPTVSPLLTPLVYYGA